MQTLKTFSSDEELFVFLKPELNYSCDDFDGTSVYQVMAYKWPKWLFFTSFGIFIVTAFATTRMPQFLPIFVVVALGLPAVGIIILHFTSGFKDVNKPIVAFDTKAQKLTLHFEEATIEAKNLLEFRILRAWPSLWLFWNRSRTELSVVAAEQGAYKRYYVASGNAFSIRKIAEKLSKMAGVDLIQTAAYQNV